MGKCANNDVEVITILTEGCGWCAKQKPVVSELQAKQMKISTRDFLEVQKKNPNITEVVKGTPTHLIKVNGKFVAKKDGFLSSDELGRVFKRYKCGVPKPKAKKPFKGGLHMG